MITAHFLRVGRSAAGKDLFIYTLKGTQAELAEFQSDKGEYARVDNATGAPLYFSTQIIPVDNGTPILKSTNGNWYPDNSAFVVAKAKTEAGGGNLGAALANEYAKQIVAASPFRAIQSGRVEAPAPELEEEEEVVEAAGSSLPQQQASQEAPSIEAKTTGKPDPKVKEPSIDNL